MKFDLIENNKSIMNIVTVHLYVFDLNKIKLSNLSLKIIIISGMVETIITFMSNDIIVFTISVIMNTYFILNIHFLIN